MKTRNRHTMITLKFSDGKQLIEKSCCIRWVYNPLTATTAIKEVLDGTFPVWNELSLLQQKKVRQVVDQAARNLSYEDICNEVHLLHEEVHGDQKERVA